MKRSRKATAPQAAVTKELFDLAKEKLQEDYLGFVSDTATEDPKRFIARNAAARDALDHLAQLATQAMPAEDVEAAAEPTLQQLIEAARIGLGENKP
ncbi:MAG TPA: hypothetical protein VGN83_23350 [Falsiroseomonas sp.]|jgi:formate dehydrogenase maturation protein FdhE|nr:hypothetical protein [Falsiroseomonas sp.]